MTEINPITITIDFISITLRPLDKNPAVVYLASLSESDRRTQQAALDTIASTRTERGLRTTSHDH